MTTVTSAATGRLLGAVLLALAPRLAILADVGAAPASEDVYAYLKDGEKIPLFSVKSASVPVAKVGTETISLRDLADALASVHQGHGGETKTPKAVKDFGPVLDRLIDLRLVSLEAQAMGIDELPQYKASVDAAKERILRESLKQKVIQDVPADPKTVDRLYRQAVREWKVTSILFEKEEDAKKMEAALQGGASFDDLAKRAVSEKRAKGSGEPQFVRESQMLPPVRQTAQKLAVGAVSRPIAVAGGVAVMRMEGERYPDDPQERAKIEAGSRTARRQEALLKYYESLLKKHAKVDKRFLKRLDLEAKKPGLDALAKDDRPIAQIHGEKPVTVADLMDELRKKYFHGVDRAAQEKKLNVKKQPTLDDLLQRRLFLKEARAQGLQDTEDFKRQVKEYANQLAFGAAFERVILPEAKVTEEDARKYYEQHPSEFGTPSLYKMEGLGFSSSKDAQAALGKLQAGTDLKWLLANAEGQLEPSKLTVQLDGFPVSAASLSPELGRALAGAKSGDYRLYADPEGGRYVIHVIEEIPPQLRPFDQVKNTIGQKLQAEKVNAAFKDWAGKLRQHYAIEVLITKIGA